MQLALPVRVRLFRQPILTGARTHRDLDRVTYVVMPHSLPARRELRRVVGPADLDMEHVYIKSRTPQLDGKVERSHRTDEDEFHQLLTYRDDVDLEKKLAECEHYYNYNRPHGAHDGKTPYEALREKLR
jgi:transposase InsO family protein